jgi:hypothetical protein
MAVKPRIHARSPSYTLAHLRADLRDHEARMHTAFTEMDARLDKLADEFRASLDKRVSLDRYRPVEMLAFGAITLIFGALVAFVLGVMQ